METVSILRRCVFLLGWVGGSLLLGTITSQTAKAGTWTEPAGHGQIIYSAFFFRSTSGYGAKGLVSPYSADGKFNQQLLMPYIQLGLTSRTTLVLNPAVPHQSYRDANTSKSSGGFGDFEVAVRRRLNATESSWVLSGQLTAMFPAYGARVDPAPGNHQFDLEPRLLLGRGGALLGRHGYFDAEAAYRFRAGAPADQVRADATTGLDVTHRITLLGQVFTIKGMRNGAPIRPNSNPNAQSDFDLYKAQGSALVSILRRTRVQAGWGHTIAGRNTGCGPTLVLGLWQNF